MDWSVLQTFSNIMKSGKIIQQHKPTDGCTCSDADLVNSILKDTTFYLSEEKDPRLLISMKIPVGTPNMSDHLNVFIDTVEQQIVVDKYHEGKIEYSGIYATDMKSPMCPVFKH